MARSRAEAMAILAAQGEFDPMAGSYNGETATDVNRAARPPSNMAWANYLGGVIPRLMPKDPTPMDRILEAEARRAEQRAGITPQAAAPAAGGPGILGSLGFDSFFGGGSAASTAAPAASTAAPAASTAMGGAGPMSMMDGTAILADGTIGTAEGALGTASTGLSGMGSLGTGTLGTGLTAGGLATVLGGLGAAGYGGYKLADRNKWDDKNEWEYSTRNGAITGAGIGTSIMPGVGTAIGAGLGGLTGFLGAQFGGGKDKDQRQRDDTRSIMKGSGLIDDAYNLTLANNDKYDIGKDGSIKNYNIDFSREGIGNTVGALLPLAFLVGQGQQGKRQSDLTGYYTNAATSSGNTSDNIKKFYSDAGLDHDSAYGAVHQAYLDGRLSKEDADSYKNGLDETYGVGAYANRKK